MVIWCEISECFTEVIWIEGKPVCFAPEPFARCFGGNVCMEDDDNFVELSDCELAAVLK